MTRGKEYLNERYLGKYFFAQHENFGYENKQFSQHESYYFLIIAQVLSWRKIYFYRMIFFKFFSES